LKGFEQNGFHFTNANGQRQSRSDSMSDTSLASPLAMPARSMNGLWRNSQSPRNTDASMGELLSEGVRISNGFSEDGRNSRSSAASASNASQVEAEWIEQYEPGVYITLLALGDGTRDLKRVRFR